MLVLAIGNAFDGLRLVGPFDGTEYAVAYAETYEKNETWEIVTVESPDVPSNEAPESEREQRLREDAELTTITQYRDRRDRRRKRKGDK